MSEDDKRNIPLYKVHMPSDIDKSVIPVLHSGKLAGGPKVTEFEQLLSEYIGNPCVVSTMDASSSLSLVLYMAGVRPGDEVIASPMACLATNEPILNLFAKAVWCDIDPLSISPQIDDLRSKITEKTKAILLFHWAGNPVDIAPVMDLAREHNLKVIDDASEAIGAEYNGKMIGNSGTDYTVFSFYANKHINTIEGGAISFADESEWERGRWLRRYGMHMPTFRDSIGELNPESDIPEPGPNSYLNHVNAAVGVEQMKYLPGIIARHRDNGEYYDRTLTSLDGITVPRYPPNSKSAHWVYTLFAERRDDLLLRLRERGVYTSKVHLRNDYYSCFSSQLADLPGVAWFHEHALSIPCGWWVTDEDREYITNCIKEGW